MGTPGNQNEMILLQHSSKLMMSSVAQELVHYSRALRHQKQMTSELLSLTRELAMQIGKDYDAIENYLVVIFQKCKTVSLTLGLLFSFV